mgnify:CR=1 FL=1
MKRHNDSYEACNEVNCNNNRDSSDREFHAEYFKQKEITHVHKKYNNRITDKIQLTNEMRFRY